MYLLYARHIFYLFTYFLNGDLQDKYMRPDKEGKMWYPHIFHLQKIMRYLTKI